MVGSHSKKRPNNIILGRTFDFTILDMIELGVEDFKKIEDFKVEKISALIKPCLVFNGPAWDQSQDLTRLRSLLIDMFQWEQVGITIHCTDLIYKFINDNFIHRLQLYVYKD